MFMASKQWRRLFLIAGGVVLVDQITKWLVILHLPLYRFSGDSVSLIPGLFSLTHIRNTGGAFGLLADLSPLFRGIIFLGLATVAAVLLIYLYLKTPPTYVWLAGALAAILGGALGNLIDRFRFGYVVDFFDFYVGNWHWPFFNFADSAITIGVTIFVIHLVFNKMPG